MLFGRWPVVGGWLLDGGEVPMGDDGCDQFVDSGVVAVMVRGHNIIIVA
jgi:hypothetical protein